MANSVDPDQTAPIGAVYSGSTLFASKLNSSVMLGNYLQQTPFSEAFLGALRVKLLTEHQLEFLRLKGGCRGSSESTPVKMPHCWKNHPTAHFIFGINTYSSNSIMDNMIKRRLQRLF